MAGSVAKGQEVKLCIRLPPMVNSAGIYKQFTSTNYAWLEYAAPRLQMSVSGIFIMTQAFHFVLRRFGFPLFTSQILAGLLLSPVIFGQQWSVWFPEFVIQIIGTLGQFGYAFFIFQSGVKMDISMVTRVGRKACYIGVLSVLTPLLYAASTIAIMGRNKTDNFKSFYLSPIYYMTSFPVIICVLSEIKILNSELGRLAQSSAIVADLFSFFSFLVVTLIKKGMDTHFVNALLEGVCVIIFILLVAFVIRPIMLAMKRSTVEDHSINPNFLYAIILLFLLCALIPEWFGDLTVMGIYILGLAVPHGPPLGSALVEKFECVVMGLFFPLFVSTCAMRVQSLKINIGDRVIKENITIAIVTLLVKFVACFLPMLCEKMPRKDAFALALIMSSKGVVELASYTFSSDSKGITADMFTLMFVIVVFMGSLVPVLVQKLYDPSRKYVGYQKRKLVDSRPDVELQLVACIHVPNNVSSIINLLGMASPNKESPIVVNVLHLIKLRGQATSTFISHQKNTKNISSFSYSENVILSFKKFEANHWGNVVIDSFTAISPPDMMHDDICTLALDKLASLIILPFHRTWYIDGSLESEDLAIRNLNCKVLETAPCSIGILIDHGYVRHQTLHTTASSSCNVAILYIGGPDDREALTFAKRMTQDTRIRLTVAHFIADDDDGEVNWEIILDSEVLKDVKNNDHIEYIKYHVKDGPETLNIVHSMLNENAYNLVIVGRRYNVDSQQTSGLKEWSEFPELGILGDVLASKDMGGKSSVLIVQQQQAVN